MLCGCRIGVWWFQRLVWESVQKKWLILVGRPIRIQTCHRKIWNPWFDKNARLHLMEEKDGFCIEEDGVEILVAARWVLWTRRHLQHFQTFNIKDFFFTLNGLKKHEMRISSCSVYSSSASTIRKTRLKKQNIQPYGKITGETPEVRSDKREPRMLLRLQRRRRDRNKLASSVDAIAISKIWKHNSLTDSLTHPMTGVGARRCYRI